MPFESFTLVWFLISPSFPQQGMPLCPMRLPPCASDQQAFLHKGLHPCATKIILGETCLCPCDSKTAHGASYHQAIRAIRLGSLPPVSLHRALYPCAMQCFPLVLHAMKLYCTRHCTLEQPRFLCSLLPSFLTRHCVLVHCTPKAALRAYSHQTITSTPMLVSPWCISKPNMWRCHLMLESATMFHVKGLY